MLKASAGGGGGDSGGGDLGGATGDLAEFVKVATGKFNLKVTSGYRTGGTSYHGKNPPVGRARDLGGAKADMLAFARYAYSTWGSNLAELIHSPMGEKQIKDGKPASINTIYARVKSSHYNHVHIAV
jgi:hypothetical protein